MPNDPDTQLPARRRRLPRRYLLSVLAALFILPMLTWLAWGWVAAARLDRALEARLDPLDIDEFNVKPTTPEQREASQPPLWPRGCC